MTDASHLVDPGLRAALDAWNQGVTDKLAIPHSEADPLRAMVILLERRHVPDLPGGPPVMLHIYRPADATDSLPAIYHIHGGGYISGSAEQFAFLHRDLVQDLGCVLIAVDYRLAPEHVFPAALDDCYAGLAWIVAHAGEIGVDVHRLGGWARAPAAAWPPASRNACGIVASSPSPSSI